MESRFGPTAPSNSITANPRRLHVRLSTLYPLLCNIFSAASLATLTLKVENSTHRRRDGERSRYKGDPQRRLAKTMFEGAAVVHGLTLVLTTSTLRHEASINLAACIGVMSWTYLPGLLLLNDVLKMSKPTKIIWMHSLPLYGIHWSITATIYLQIAVHSGLLSWTSLLGQGLLVTSILFGQKICEPAILIAKRHGKSRSGNLSASLLQLTTFAWLDPLIWTGFRKRFDIVDVWALTESNMCIAVLEVSKSATSRLLFGRLTYSSRYLLLGQCICSHAPTFAMQLMLNHIETTSCQSSLLHHVWIDLRIILASGAVYEIETGKQFGSARLSSLRYATSLLLKFTRRSQDEQHQPPNLARQQYRPEDSGATTAQL